MQRATRVVWGLVGATIQPCSWRCRLHRLSVSAVATSSTPSIVTYVRTDGRLGRRPATSPSLGRHGCGRGAPESRGRINNGRRYIDDDSMTWRHDRSATISLLLLLLLQRQHRPRCFVVSRNSAAERQTARKYV